MGNAFGWVVKLLPLVLNTIVSVEGMFGKGADKKAAVVTSATSIMQILTSTGLVSSAQLAAAPAAVGEFNDAAVKFLTAMGVINTDKPVVVSVGK